MSAPRPTPQLDSALAEQRTSESQQPLRSGRNSRIIGKLHITGRIGIYELLVPDDNLIERISQGCTLNEIREMGRALGMKSLRHDGVDKVREGITTLEEVYRATA